MDDNYTKAVLSACHSTAHGELANPVNAEDPELEERVIGRANEIYQELIASTDQETLSEAARSAMAKAGAILEANADGTVESPYQEKKFDYQAQADQTVLPAMVELMGLFGTYASRIAPIQKYSKQSDEEDEASFSAMHEMSIEAFGILNRNSVGMSKYKDVFSKVKELVSYLEEIQAQQMTGHRHEVISRVMGGINPGTGKLDAGFATYADLLDARERVKGETDGPGGEDMFSLKAGTQAAED